MLLENVLINTVELGFGQHGEQLPAEVECLVYRSVFIVALIYKFLLKRSAELHKALIRRGELILAYDGRECLGILHLCIGREELVCEHTVVGARVALAYAVLHQTTATAGR